MDTVLHHKTSSAVIKSIPLSSNVQRRIDEMATDIEDRLCSEIRNAELSLQLNESTLPRNEALLLGYVCFVYDGVSHEELEMGLLLNTDTWGEEVL